MHEFFRDFDNLRKGLVTESIFLRVLNANLNIELSRGETKWLVETYLHSNGFVDY